MLESKGFQADTAYDGQRGAEYALSDIYDLLIVDVMLPKLSGYQLVKQLRAKHCDVPVLMLTAKAEVMDRVEGLNSGADFI